MILFKKYLLKRLESFPQNISSFFPDCCCSLFWMAAFWMQFLFEISLSLSNCDIMFHYQIQWHTKGGTYWSSLPQVLGVRSHSRWDSFKKMNLACKLFEYCLFKKSHELQGTGSHVAISQTPSLPPLCGLVPGRKHMGVCYYTNGIFNPVLLKDIYFLQFFSD